MSSGKPYVREVSRTRWFFRHPRYLRYMARELSCIFIGAHAFVLIFGVRALANGEAAYASFLRALQTPVAVALLIVALAFSVYHSITWFNLTPKAMRLQVGEEFLPDAAISGAHYAGWALATLVVLYWSGVFQL